MEFSSFLSVSYTSAVVIDRKSSDKMRISFNLTFPKLQCEFLSVDVADVLGVRRLNITKTVQRWRIDRDNKKKPMRQVQDRADPQYGHVGHVVNEDLSLRLNSETFPDAIKKYKVLAFGAVRFTPQVLVVNFFAPWCPYCRALVRPLRRS